MSLIQKLYEAQENKDLEKYNEVVSECLTSAPMEHS